MLKELDFTFVLFRLFPSIEGPQVSTFPGLWVYLARVQPVSTGR